MNESKLRKYIDKYKRFYKTDKIECGTCKKERTEENKSNGGWLSNGDLIFWFCSKECYEKAIRKLY